MDIKQMTLVAVAAATGTAMAVMPEVSNVTMTQAANRLVTITYQLANAPAVVTLGIETNANPSAAANDPGWTSIGGEAVCNAKGDVWKQVSGKDTYTITWRPDHSWRDDAGNGFKIAANGARARLTAWPLDNTPAYMVVDISAGAQPNTQSYYPSADFVPGGVSNSLYKTTTLLMRKIMAKDVTWTMGSVAEASRRPEREATHRVKLSGNYYIGVFEVTQSQWEQVTGYNPSYFTYERALRPVENVCLNDIRHGAGAETTAAGATGGIYPEAPYGDSFLGKLRKTTGIDFDLPSEAQWEFAARAGNGEGYWGNGAPITMAGADPALNQLGRYDPSGSYKEGNNPPSVSIPPSDGGTAIVGTCSPNSWGLYDMHGNVNESCLDAFAADISSLNGVVNTTLDASKTRVFRGGTWHSLAYQCRSAFRSGSPQDGRRTHLGLRVACPVDLQ